MRPDSFVMRDVPRQGILPLALTTEIGSRNPFEMFKGVSSRPMNVVMMELSFLHEPLFPVSNVVCPNPSGILLDEFNQFGDAVTCLTLGLAFVVCLGLS